MASLRPVVRFAERELWNISVGQGSVGLSAGEPHNLGPLFGLISNELAEVGGRTCKRRVAQIGEPRLQFGICESSIDLPVKFVDDLDGRVLWCPDPLPATPLIA